MFKIIFTFNLNIKANYIFKQRKWCDMQKVNTNQFCESIKVNNRDNSNPESKHNKLQDIQFNSNPESEYNELQNIRFNSNPESEHNKLQDIQSNSNPKSEHNELQIKNNDNSVLKSENTECSFDREEPYEE